MSDESKDLVIHPSSDMMNAGVSTGDPSQVQHMQAALLDWCRAKLERSRVEASELEQSCLIARENGFRRVAFDAATARAVKAVHYYEKVVAAMEAGYCVFPTTDVTLFAVRTKRRKPDAQKTKEHWGNDPAGRTVPAGTLPAGEGRYVDDQPQVYSFRESVPEKQADGTVKDVTRKFFYSEDFDAVDFPIHLGKPEILKATSRAMALKVFDELGVLPAYERGRGTDPVIVGRIIHPHTKKRVSFLISWFVDTREI